MGRTGADCSYWHAQQLNMSLNRGMLQMQVEGYMRGRIMSIDMMSYGQCPWGVSNQFDR